MLVFATEAILLLFGAFVIAIAVVRFMRNRGRVAELRAGPAPAMNDDLERRPSDEFHDAVWRPLCERVAAAAAARLSRALSRKERQAIWRTRTPLALTVALKEIESAEAPGAVEAVLRSLPSGLDRPDPTRWCEGGGRSKVADRGER